MQDNYSVLPNETKPQYRERMFDLLRKQQEDFRNKLKTGEIKVVMDVDDFGFLMPGFDDLLRLKKSFPNFRITCFTIPMPKEFFTKENSKHFKAEKYKRWAKIVNSYDWLEIALHGFAHTHYEMDVEYGKAELVIKATENLFKEIGLEYSKIFKAPYWQYSYDALNALHDKGYVIALDRNHPREVPKGAKTYIFNHSFEEALPMSEIIKSHGHFTGKNKNNIAPNLHNILASFPKETQFMTIGEYLNVTNTNKN